MCHPDVKDNPVQIVSIAGAFRKGKSFLLGFFLKYLETQLQVINCYLKKQAKKREVRTHEILSSLQANFTLKCDWLSENDKIEGFQWRGGSKRVTSGIQIWSKPFVCENKVGEKVRFSHLIFSQIG